MFTTTASQKILPALAVLFCCLFLIASNVWAATEVSSSIVTNYCLTYSYGECSSAGGGTDTGGAINIVGGVGGGSVSSPGPTPKTISGTKCFPQVVRREADCDDCRAVDKDSLQNSKHPVGSAVSTVHREYTRDNVDLSVKVPGGAIAAKRWYFNNQWHWEHLRHNLTLKRNSLGMIDTIEKGIVSYAASETDENVFTHDIYTIFKQDQTYRWEDPNGIWKEYDASGKITTRGSRNGTMAQYVYEAGDNGKLIGIKDKLDSQVLWFEYDTQGRLILVRDAENRRAAYGYTDALLTTVTDVLDHVTTFDYDEQERIIQVIAANTRESNITYDDNGHVTRVADQDGVGHFFVYDYDKSKKEYYAQTKPSSGLIKEVWYDKDGETRKVSINGRTMQSIAKDGRALIITDEKGKVTRKEYDEWDNLTKVIHPDEAEVSYEYEHKFNKRIKEVDENGAITLYEYDEDGNLTKKTEAATTASERITEYSYDADGNLLSIKRLTDGSTAEALTTMTYDALGNLTSVTDPENNITQFTSHDIMGNVLTKVDARDKLWTYEYDNKGQLTKITDPLTNITQLFYDQVGNKTKEIDAENKQKTFEYDADSNLIKITDATGNETIFEYNSDNKLTKQTDAEGRLINYVYDNEQRLIKTVDGNGNAIDLEYAEANGSGCSSCSGGRSDQPASIIYPSFEKQFVYDARGRKSEEKDVLSATTTYSTSFFYDLGGNLVTKTDKESKTTTYEYDDLNRLKKVVDATSGSTEYTYDNRDNLIELKDAKTNVTRFEYDGNNRLTKEIRPLGQATDYQWEHYQFVNELAPLC